MTKSNTHEAPRVTKAAKLLTLLQTGTAASLEEMVEATGWQSHTVRAAIGATCTDPARLASLGISHELPHDDVEYWLEE